MCPTESRAMSRRKGCSIRPAVAALALVVGCGAGDAAPENPRDAQVDAMQPADASEPPVGRRDASDEAGADAAAPMAGRAGGQADVPDWDTDASCAEPVGADPDPEACAMGTVEVAPNYDDPEIPQPNDDVEEQVFEGVLVGQRGVGATSATLDGMRVRDPDGLMAPFVQHFVKIVGKAFGYLESVFLYPRTVECAAVECTGDGSGRLELRTSSGLEIELSAGDDEMMCTGSMMDAGALSLRFTTLEARVHLRLPDFDPTERTPYVREGFIGINLHELYLDPSGSGEHTSGWSGECEIEIATIETVWASPANAYRITGRARNCTLEPNGWGQAICLVTLDALSFATRFAAEPD